MLCYVMLYIYICTRYLRGNSGTIAETTFYAAEACVLVCFVARKRTASAAAFFFALLCDVRLPFDIWKRMWPAHTECKLYCALVALLGLRYVLRACHGCASAREIRCILIALEHTNFTNTILTYPLIDKIPASCFIGRHVPNEKGYKDRLADIYRHIAAVAFFELSEISCIAPDMSIILSVDSMAAPRVVPRQTKTYTAGDFY